jgi:hypothetical protein
MQKTSVQEVATESADESENGLLNEGLNCSLLCSEFTSTSVAIFCTCFTQMRFNLAMCRVASSARQVGDCRKSCFTAKLAYGTRASERVPEPFFSLLENFKVL